MTPEERFIRIENALQTVADNQVLQDGQGEKNGAGIRDLIVISRTCLDSIEPWTQQFINTLHDTDLQNRRARGLQDEATEKLNALIDTVDRIIRRDKGIELS